MEVIDQAYFWTEEWQEAEAEATADIENGRVTRFSNVEDAINWLHSQRGGIWTNKN